MSFRIHADMERRRNRRGPYASEPGEPHFGCFLVNTGNAELRILASSGSEEVPWEHVSVSLERRTPTWAEMCLVKGWFWEPEDCVVQYHPPESDYVNFHKNTLHLWRPIGVEIPRPPIAAV